MAWNFSLANYASVWALLVQIGLLLLFLLVGNILRRKIPILRKCHIPSALIGGAILLVVKLITNAITKSAGVSFEFVNDGVMQVITYHSLAIGFAAISLRTEKAKTRTRRTQVFEFGALQGGTYMLQAGLGLAITIVMFLFTKPGQNGISYMFNVVSTWTSKSEFITNIINGIKDFLQPLLESNNVISYVCGLILPLGFGQGPGNALTWDINYTNTPATLFSGNGSFGLSLASIGFIVASVFGVIYINVQKKRGLLTPRTRDDSEGMSVSEFQDPDEIPDNESVDKFTIQLGFVAVAYALAFGFMCLLSLNSFLNTLAWGFNFLWASLAAILVKFIVKQLRKKKIMNRGYINNYQMDRVSGFFFDLMIVAGVAAIEIDDIKNYIVPIVVLSIVGAFATLIYIRKVTKNCFRGFENESFLMAFGTLTGTASNGMILMKEIDPDLRTPVSNLYILSNFPAILMVAPLLLLLNFAGSSFTNACIACGIFAVLWIGYTVFLFRRKIFKKKYKDNPAPEWREK